MRKLIRKLGKLNHVRGAEAETFIGHSKCKSCTTALVQNNKPWPLTFNCFTSFFSMWPILIRQHRLVACSTQEAALCMWRQCNRFPTGMSGAVGAGDPWARGAAAQQCGLLSSTCRGNTQRTLARQNLKTTERTLSTPPSLPQEIHRVYC